MNRRGLGALVFLVSLALFISPALALGDMNKDGSVNVLDLALAKNPKIISGDTNADSKVNIIDLSTVGLAYGSQGELEAAEGMFAAAESEPGWNPNADVKEDGKINILDLATVGINYNKNFPESDIDPIFTISPAVSDLKVGKNGTIEVTIQTIPPEAQVYAVELKIYFDKNLINAESVTEGSFLKQGGKQTFPIITIDNANGKIEFASTRFGTATGAGGSGTLINLIFSGKAVGSSYLNIDDILVSDPNLQPITNITANNGTANVVLSDKPVINSVADDSSAASPTNAGNDVTFTVNWADTDSAQARFYACDSNNIDSAGCHSREFCSTANSAANPQTCKYTTQQTDNTTENYWVRVCDDSNVCSDISGPQTFNVNHKPNITVPDQAVNEDTAPPVNWVDLWAFTADPEDADSTLTFALTGQTNQALISCQLAGNRYINCNKPAQDQSGFSDLTVKATDPHGLQDQDTFGVTVNTVNDLPTQPAVDVTPDTAYTNNNLLCTIITPSQDADLDGITYSYAWYRDGVLQPGLITNTVAAANTAKGETWRCNVTPNDGTGDGPAGLDQVTVQNSPPSIDTFSPAADPSIDETANQAFSITRSDPDGDPTTAKWYLDGQEVAAGNAYTYNAGGHDSQGTYEVKAVVSDGQLAAQHIWQLTVFDNCTRILLTAGNNIFSLPRNQQKIFNQLNTDCNVVFENGRDDLAYYKPNAENVTNTSNYVFIALNTALFPGQGYFVKVTADCYIQMCDGVVQTGDIGYLGTKQLKEGWNLAGSTTYQTAFGAGTCQLFGGVGILKYGYNVNSCQDVPGYNGGYEYCNEQWGIKRCRCEVDNFEPGSGYWIRTKNDCVLA